MCRYRLGRAWNTTHATLLTRTSAIVAYGRVAEKPATRTVLSPARRRRSSEGIATRRCGRREGVRARGSFGARRRRREPQYGHSVMYGLTSEPHCLHTTNRSAPEDIEFILRTSGGRPARLPWLLPPAPPPPSPFGILRAM